MFCLNLTIIVYKNRFFGANHSTSTIPSAFTVIFIEFLIDRRKSKDINKSGADVRSVASMAVPLGISAYIRQALLTLEHILIPKRLRARGDSLSESLSAYGTLHGMALPMILYPEIELRKNVVHPKLAIKKLLQKCNAQKQYKK